MYQDDADADKTFLKLQHRIDGIITCNAGTLLYSAPLPFFFPLFRPSVELYTRLVERVKASSLEGGHIGDIFCQMVLRVVSMVSITVM